MGLDVIKKYLIKFRELSIFLLTLQTLHRKPITIPSLFILSPGMMVCYIMYLKLHKQNTTQDEKTIQF